MPSKEKNFKRTLVTSALPYANGPIHIGHLAGVYVPADIYVRFLRMKGEDVIFIGGSDEHGVPITIKARQQGVTPQQIVDKYHGMIRKSFSDFGISFDIYSRTSSPVHHQTAAEFFRRMYDAGLFIEKVTGQYFDEATGTFLADRYITGTCPVCNSDNAYGDQCEKCGSSLNATDLINPRSVLSGNPPVMKDTRHWYLPLDRYEPWLREWILKEHKEDWKTNVYGQCKSWLDQGLQPRAVTRDLDWGVKVPVEGSEGKVLYVWFDAPIGYISATRELTPDWEKYWKDPETRLIHFIGKDNIVFHCIIFPAMLKGEGTFIVPDNVPAFEFMNLENDKISTSRNWAVWLHEYLEEFPGMQDVLRYALTSNAPETKDNDFTWKDFQARNNNELVAIFGNFINRTMVLTQKYFEGCVPPAGIPDDLDRAVLSEMAQFPRRIAESLHNFRFREGLTGLMNLARLGNKYLTDSEPWKHFETDPQRVGTILNISLQICAQLSIVCEPFLPFSAVKIRRMLGIPDFTWKDATRLDWLSEGHRLNDPELLFKKIEDKTIDAQIRKLTVAIPQSRQPAAPLPEITFDDFSKLDLRAGTILEAERVPGADKLLKLKIDTGIDRRTVVSGIAKYFTPEEITGRRVSVLMNLAPRKLRGIESQGMILMAENPDGSLFFVDPGEGPVNGAVIR